MKVRRRPGEETRAGRERKMKKKGGRGGGNKGEEGGRRGQGEEMEEWRGLGEDKCNNLSKSNSCAILKQH